MSDFPLRDHCEEKAKKLAMPHFTLIASDDSAIPTILEWMGRNDATLSDAKYKEAKAIVDAMSDCVAYFKPLSVLAMKITKRADFSLARYPLIGLNLL